MNWLLWQSEAGTKKMIGGPGGRGCKLTYVCMYPYMYNKAAAKLSCYSCIYGYFVVQSCKKM